MGSFFTFSAQNPTQTSGGAVRISDNGKVVVGHFATASPLHPHTGNADYFIWEQTTGYEFQWVRTLYPNFDGSIVSYETPFSPFGSCWYFRPNIFLSHTPEPKNWRVRALADNGDSVGFFADASANVTAMSVPVHTSGAGFTVGPFLDLGDVAGGSIHGVLEAVSGDGMRAVGRGTDARGSESIYYEVGMSNVQLMPFMANMDMPNWLHSISHDGRLAVGGKADGTGLIFDFVTGQTITVWSPQYSNIQFFAVSSGNHQIAVGAGFDTATSRMTALLYVYPTQNLVSLEEVLINQHIKHPDLLQLMIAYDISADGNRIVGTGLDGAAAWAFLATILASAV